MLAALVVHAWPEGLPQALADLHGNTGLTVISVITPPAASRPEARLVIRHALQSTVAAWLNQPLSAIKVLSNPGQRVQVMAPGTALHVAISHMPGLSVAAIGTHGAVGVDVMAVGEQALPPDWAQVAQDYLGPQATLALQSTLPAHRPAAFAQAWVSLEARLKCLGLGLTEWTPALGLRLDACGGWPLELPQGICGAVAWHG
jgi:4'-phosphopantetheinyl transferase